MDFRIPSDFIVNVSVKHLHWNGMIFEKYIIINFNYNSQVFETFLEYDVKLPLSTIVLKDTFSDVLANIHTVRTVDPEVNTVLNIIELYAPVIVIDDALLTEILLKIPEG